MIVPVVGLGDNLSTSFWLVDWCAQNGDLGFQGFMSQARSGFDTTSGWLVFHRSHHQHAPA